MIPRGRIWNITVIIVATVSVALIVIGDVFEFLTFKAAWFKYFFILLLVSSAIISWLDLKGKFRKRDQKLANRFYNAGEIFIKQGDIKAAISNYKMATNMDPEHANAHIALGQLFYTTGKLEKSVKHLRKAVEIEPKNATARESADIMQKLLEERRQIGDIYRSDIYGFSIKRPEGWVVDSVLKREMIFQFRFRRDALLCLVAGPTQGHLETIKDLENKALRAIHISRFNFHSLKHITVDGIEGIEVVYDRPPKLKSKKVGFVNDGIEFIITAEVLSSKFEEYEPILDACIQSFRFEKRLLGFFEKRIIDQSRRPGS